MARTSQQRTVEIDRGLFLVRYASTEDDECPPKVTVRPHKGDQRITLVLHPDNDEAVMWEPGACVVVRAIEPAMIAIEVTAQRRDGSAAASVRIEPLTQGKHPSAAPTDDNVLPMADGLRVLGHVAGIGDVVVGGGEWIAGPSAPSRIEGIAIEWPEMPDDIELRYSVKTARAQSISGRTTGAGTFAGTRGKALPIVGVNLDLSGPGADDIQIEVEAIFLGSPVVRRTGTEILLAGPTGREPLVGLRVGLRRAGAAVRPQPVGAPARPNNASRVRVFRSRPRQDQAVAR
jgi:hypothetical protein